MMQDKQIQLLLDKRFFPLFLTQCFQAFNDCVFKSAMAVMLAYRLSTSAANQEILVTLAGAIFFLPYIFFSATAGDISDKYDRATIIRYIKGFEILFGIVGCIGFYLGNITLLFVTLFLMGLHSAFFSPVKLAMLPEHLHENELIRGNAWIEASTFFFVLLGTIVGTKVILGTHGFALITGIIMLTAIAGFISSLYLPEGNQNSPELHISKNILRETYEVVQHATANPKLYVVIIAISWFWVVGATFSQQFFNFCKDTLQVTPGVAAIFQTSFSLGIAIGSLLCHKLTGDEVNGKYIPVAMLGVTIFILDLCYSSSHYHLAHSGDMINSATFITSWRSWHLLIDTFLIALFGGIYIVPLYAIMQIRSDKDYLSRTIAATNVINAIAMMLGSVLTIALFTLHFSLLQIFFILGVLNTVMGLYCCKLLPHEIRQGVLRWLLSKLFDVEVNGIDNYLQAGERAMILANHTSLLDIMLISAFLPDQFTIAVNRDVTRKWWVQPFISLVDVFAIDPTSSLSTRVMIKAVNDGKRFIIFPEGKLTNTGSLMKVYQAPGLIALRSNATIVPIRIDGAKHSIFTRLRGKVIVQWFPKITLNIMPPHTLDADPRLSKRELRQHIANDLYALMTDLIFESSNYQSTLFQALLDARKLNGGRAIVAEDTERNPLNYNQFISRCFMLGKYMATRSEMGEHVGVMLPTSIAAMVTFFGLQAYGRIPAMLNFSAGIRNILSACDTADIKTIYTSKKFIATAKLYDVVEALTAANYRVIYLESLRTELSLWAKIAGFVRGYLAEFAHANVAQQMRASDPAVILFTSGSEGIPKAVKLSHTNLNANANQLRARVDFGPSDIMFNALPVFHCFGLMAGGILPLTSGIRTFFYPSPLHYRIVPELIYDTNATIFFATDTFLTGYARYANAYDFYNIRAIFAGAEKLKPETAKIWSERFGIRVFEGYGATETSPVLATNTPLQHVPGSVGRLLPGIRYRIAKVDGIDNGGRLQVAGPNIMLGYIDPKDHSRTLAPKDGWYDTGDIVSVDQGGSITINGRAKRFAKIGGEMVSLTAIELYLKTLWPEHHHAVVSMPDPKKGECIVLYTENPEATRDDIIAYVRRNGYSELTIPKKIYITESMPVLATGKIDYVTVNKLASKD